MADLVTIAGFAGSLRAGSYNRALLRNAVKLAPADVRVVEIDISEIPLYNQDVEDAAVPPAVTRMRDAIRAADALLIVSPEYNFSMSGVTKNVIDWASRPFDNPSVDGKPVGFAGVSRGRYGTARSKIALVPICVGIGMIPLADPQVNVPSGHHKFNDAGELIDADVKGEVEELLTALAAWARRLRTRA